MEQGNLLYIQPSIQSLQRVKIDRPVLEFHRVYLLRSGEENPAFCFTLYYSFPFTPKPDLTGSSAVQPNLGNSKSPI